MFETPTTLIELNLDLVDLAINSVLQQTHFDATDDEYDELRAEVSKALVVAANRWEAYCIENGYSDSMPYFRAFAMRRMKGSIIDRWRKNSPLTRDELDLSTYARKHSKEASAEKYGVSIETVEKALYVRDLHVSPSEIDGDTTLPKEYVSVPHSLWEVLFDIVNTLPPIAKAWVALVYVEGVPIKDARKILGITDTKTAMVLQGYVEYVMVSRVLAETGIAV